jgi:hypothetical protein
MHTAALTALLLLAGIASASAESDSERDKLLAEPQLTQPVIDATILASRNINILRLRILSDRFRDSTPSGRRAGTYLPALPLK